jgi:putative membrane protein
MPSLISRSPLLWFSVVFFAVLGWSVLHPVDRFTWFLEVIPALVGYGVLLAIARRWQFTTFTLVVILLHMIVLMVGGHYTYAEVPGFRFDIDWLGGPRNDYDKLGHFFQGFAPALVAREVLRRKQVVRTHGWLGFLVVAVCLAISAAYELIEWWVRVATGSGGDAFLGTQGFVWDTQSDMLFALIGATVAVAALGWLQDRFLRQSFPAIA